MFTRSQSRDHHCLAGQELGELALQELDEGGKTRWTWFYLDSMNSHNIGKIVWQQNSFSWILENARTFRGKRKAQTFSGKKRLGNYKNPLQVYMEVVDTPA